MKPETYICWLSCLIAIVNCMHQLLLKAISRILLLFDSIVSSSCGQACFFWSFPVFLLITYGFCFYVYFTLKFLDIDCSCPYSH
uniref:Putative ovule protein n=1 Tax=Solanum chacoense TaxID=4108 RepID=A0A0V0GUX6_SOLCH